MTLSCQLARLLLISLLAVTPLCASSFTVGGIIVKVGENGVWVYVTEIVNVSGTSRIGDVVYFPYTGKRGFNLASSFAIDGHAVSPKAALVPGRQFFLFAKGGGFAASSCAIDAVHGYLQSAEGDTVVLAPLPQAAKDPITISIDGKASWQLAGKEATKSALKTNAWVTCYPKKAQQIFLYTEEATPSFTTLPDVHKHTRQGQVLTVEENSTYTIAVHGQQEPQPVKLRDYIILDGRMSKQEVTVGQEMIGWTYRNRDASNFIGVSNPLVQQGAVVSQQADSLSFTTSAGKQVDLAIAADAAWHVDGEPSEAAPAGTYAWVQIVEPQEQRWQIVHYPLQDRSFDDLLKLVAEDQELRGEALLQLSRSAHLHTAEDMARLYPVLAKAADPTDAAISMNAAATLKHTSGLFAKEPAVIAAASEAAMTILETVRPNADAVTKREEHKKMSRVVGVVIKIILEDDKAEERFRDRIKAIEAHTIKSFRVWFE